MKSRKSKLSYRWVSLRRFLAQEESLGPSEKMGGELVYWDSADNDSLTLLALLREHKELNAVACIPSARLCLYQKGDDIIVRGRSPVCPPPPKGYKPLINIRAGVVATGLPASPKLWLPVGFTHSLRECGRVL